jgi:hypothetical protein
MAVTFRRVVPEQRERLDRRVIHDRVEVSEHRVEAEVFNLTLRVARSAPVVQQELHVLPEPLVCVPEARNSPLAEHVAQGCRRQPHERRPIAPQGVGDGDVVGGAGVPETRLHAVPSRVA